MSVVLITGCSSGIGLETALAFARRGDDVYASMRNPAKADRLRQRASSEGVGVEVVALDVVDDASVSAAVAEIEHAVGAIDVLVNNAGVDYPGPVETIDIGTARAVFETNLWGAVRTTRAVLPKMRDKGSGVIVNVTSAAGRVPGHAYNGFYGASKHALGTLSEALSMEVAPFGIRVVCIEPGFFATDILANAGGWEVDQTTPYAADETWMADFYRKSLGVSGGDAKVVADAIVRAASDPATPMHNLVGPDAELFVQMVAAAETFEAWVPVGTQIVEGTAGPRPVQPKV